MGTKANCPACGTEFEVAEAGVLKAPETPVEEAPVEASESVSIPVLDENEAVDPVAPAESAEVAG